MIHISTKRPCWDVARLFPISGALTDELIHCKPVYNSASDLMEFAIETQNCWPTFCQMSSKSDLYSFRNIEAMVERLTPELR